MKKLKGFTLVELVVVIAIIGILSATVMPNLFGQTSKSRYNTAQKQAESIFNSAQTIAQKYETIDRAIKDADKKLFSGGHRYSNAGIAEVNTANDKKWQEAGNFVKKLKSMNTHLDNGCKWVVEIDNYKVIHVMWAEDENSNYVGVYCGCDENNDGKPDHLVGFDNYTKEKITNKAGILKVS